MIGDLKELLKSRPTHKIGFAEDLNLLNALSEFNPDVMDKFPFMIFNVINISDLSKICKLD